MSYEYTDPTGFILSVWGNEDYTYVASKRSEREEPFGVYLPHADAPAVALAILEAAGINTEGPLLHDGSERESLESAVTHLRAASRRRKRAAREAEDAKVQEFRTAFTKAHHKGACVPEWKDVLEADREKWRNKYRAAREFFAKEANDAR